jgi:hypothetical protein
MSLLGICSYPAQIKLQSFNSNRQANPPSRYFQSVPSTDSFSFNKSLLGIFKLKNSWEMPRIHDRRCLAYRGHCVFIREKRAALFFWLVLRLPFAFDVTTPVVLSHPVGVVFNAACTLKCSLKTPQLNVFSSTVPNTAHSVSSPIPPQSVWII